MSADAIIVKAGSNEEKQAFKDLGFSVFMVRGMVGLAQLEVCRRAEHLVEVYWKNRGLTGNTAEMLREIASVSDAVHKLQDAEKKARGG